MKKIPLRSCVITREKLPKKELIRIVRTKTEVVLDLTGKVGGRGAYIKKDIEVINKAKNSKALDKALETNVPDNIYDELLKLID